MLSQATLSHPLAFSNLSSLYVSLGLQEMLHSCFYDHHCHILADETNWNHVGIVNTQEIPVTEDEAKYCDLPTALVLFNFG